MVGVLFLYLYVIISYFILSEALKTRLINKKKYKSWTTVLVDFETNLG